MGLYDTGDDDKYIYPTYLSRPRESEGYSSHLSVGSIKSCLQGDPGTS